MKSTIKEIIDKFNLPLRLHPEVMELEFKGDFKLHTFENNKHIFKDEEGQFLLIINLDDPKLFIDYHNKTLGLEMGFDDKGEASLMS